LATKLFKEEGFSCSQAVLAVFNDLTGLDMESSVKLASSFGGGMARLGEVCGAVSGMFMAVGMICGPSNPSDQKAKTKHYKCIQSLAAEFKEQNGSIICRELLRLPNKLEETTQDSKQKACYIRRPCSELVKDAVGML
jgi:C_GCAxxG_C_C family probable redox protein